MNSIYITTGDHDGIGLEITAKALYKLGPQPGFQFIIFRSDYKSERWIKLLQKKFVLYTVSELPSNFKKITDKKVIIDVCSSQLAPLWFSSAVSRCKKSPKNSALVTGPISKPFFIKSGLNVLGHTGYLKKSLKKENLFMAFIGKFFNVVLATDHIPLASVTKNLTKKKFKAALLASENLLKILEGKSKEIAVLGLNPHAGDDDLIGKEDNSLLLPLIKSSNKKSKNINGPLSPDSAFLKKNWDKYAIFLALYHDQGLIPFKAIHGQDSGIHLTLGLPFLRTSVDHGTAKDIFNKNVANCQSMYEAIQFVIKTLTKTLKKENKL
jgi:4-hydroxythreonine-4-phosphate dehydrogenase